VLNNKIIKLFICSFFALCVIGIKPAAAQSYSYEQYLNYNPNSETIQSIQIDGVERIDPETVKSYIALREGDLFDPARINESLKQLYDTGLFSDVSIGRQGKTLLVKVMENPVISRVAFEGNKRIGDEILASETQTKERGVYTRTKVQNDTARIRDIYRQSGRFSAKVEPKLIERAQNRVDVVFEIEEGDVTDIRRISFIGNKNFSDGTLRAVVQTKESAWYRVLSADDTYDPDRLAFDKELLRKFYSKEGYADINITSAVAELSPDGDEFFITFTVDEGERYTVEEINIATQLPELEVDTLWQAMTFVEGDWYNADQVEDSLQNLTDIAGTQGYAFVDVRPMIDRNRDAKTLNVTFSIKEGPKVFVERINIYGNLRTLDEVIRREFRLVEGDAFNTAKLRRSRQRLQNLGFFESVKVTTERGSSPDKVVINAEVAEQSTGELSFGAGFSTTESILGDVRLRERNLLGRGQDLKLAVSISGERQEFDVGFTEPYFLDREISAGVDAFRRTRDFQDESSHDEKKTGGKLRLGYKVNESLRHDLHYTLRDIEISDVDDDASRFIKDQEGSTLTSFVGQVLTYDKRDNKANPTNGYFARFTNDIAGLGGDAEFIRAELAGGYYTPVAEEWVLSFTGEVGYIHGLGEDVRISDRFFVGGASLRGFEDSGIGPRDTDTDDALGGNFFAVASAEVGFPLGLPNDLGLRGHLFADAGTLTEIDDNGPEVADVDSVRASVGAGLSWRSPFGPIRVDVATPVSKEDFDEEETFRFNFGTRF
jgi:outer membrane protein insertion porin family